MPQTCVSVDSYVDRLVAEAPPLTPEQSDRLRVLLARPDDRQRAA